MQFTKFLFAYWGVLALATPLFSISAQATVKVKAEPGHSVLLKNQKQKAYIRIHLEGEKPATTEDRPPVNITIVIDKSGSMGGAKMERAKDAAIMAVGRLSPEDIVSVVTYDTQVKVIVPATKVGDSDYISERIEKIRPGGSTALYAGTQTGIREVSKFLDKNKVNRVILISDGLANVGPSKPDVVAELGRKAAKDGIAITTIGLGLGYNEDLMAKLAFNSDGNHAFVKNADDLVAVFNNEFGDVLSVVAQDVEIEVILHNRVIPLRSLGREVTIDENRVRIRLNQIYGSQQKEVILEVEAPEDFSEEELELAEVRIRYLDMKSKEQKSDHSTVQVKLVEDKKDWEASANKSVMTSVATQIAVIENERAVKLRDEGKVEEARGLLSSNAAYLKSAADKYGSQKLKKMSADNEKEADNLDGNNWAATRKLMRSRQHQGKTQQKY
ncbi:MAG: vWA domain-containing protein [Methyloligellaceae bacterium]